MRHNIKSFELKPEHIKLLQQTYVRWEDGEAGAPAIDCKRPYGNGWVPGDVATILGLEWDKEADDFPEELEEFCYKIHEETEIALQIVLNTLSFEPGLYKRTEEYCSRTWVKVMSDTEVKLRNLQKTLVLP